MKCFFVSSITFVSLSLTQNPEKPRIINETKERTLFTRNIAMYLIGDQPGFLVTVLEENYQFQLFTKSGSALELNHDLGSQDIFHFGDVVLLLDSESSSCDILLRGQTDLCITNSPMISTSN